MTTPDTPSGGAGVVREDAPGKINLTLRVAGRRGDGRHDLASLVVFADVGDRLTASLAAESGVSLEVSGPFAGDVPAGDGNLVSRAARMLANAVKNPAAVALTLVKTLPVAAGIGGGSADAAATLRALSRLWKRSPRDAALSACARDLGADVPVCLAGRAGYMTGAGESIRPLSLPELPAVLVHPGVAVQTGDVFAALDAVGGLDSVDDLPPPPSRLAAPADVADWCRPHRNALQETAAVMVPVIADVLGALEKTAGCRLARMSGSGATCFALFDSPDQADHAARRISGDHSWWVRSSILNRRAQC